MRENIFGGLLIAVDGANGVGKTTLVECIYNILKNCGVEVFCTQEPTDTQRGDFIRRIAETKGGEGLACLVAADRYFHLEDEIIPMLKNNKVVISDRYILSSLLFQRMDGVDTEFILEVNGNAVRPDMQIVVVADEKTIKTRLAERSEQLNRFEMKTQTEIGFLDEGIQTFKELGINIITIENVAEIELCAITAVEYILEAYSR